MNKPNPVVPIGTVVKPWGKVIAIYWTGTGKLRERYYILQDKHGDLSFMPSVVVEISK